VPPQLSSLTFSTHTVDLTNGPRRVSVTAQATDPSTGPTSGVQAVQVEFSRGHNGIDALLNLTSGTATNGTWKGAAHFPHTGTWSVTNVFVTDGSDNLQIYGRGGKAPTSPTDLRLHPDWDSSVSVVGGGAGTPPRGPAVKPGKLTGFRLAPKAVNTTHSAKRVRVTADFKGRQPRDVAMFLVKNEGGLGIGFSKTGAVQVPSAASRFGRAAAGKAIRISPFFKLVSLRQTTHRHWAGHVKIGRWVGHIVAKPTLIAIFGPSVRPRFKQFSADRLDALHFTHSLKITGGVDTTRPALTGLRVTPISVDTTSGAEAVTVTARATDRQSGVAFARAHLTAGPGRFAPGSSLTVHMTRLGDVWTGQAKVRECVPSGAWRVSVDLVDNAENVARFSSKSLIAAGLPGQITVTSHPGDVEPPSVDSSTAAAAHHMITLDFSEGVKNVTDSTLSVFALAPASTRFQSPLTISGVVCSDGTGTVACSGSGGLVTSAVLTVPDVVAGRHYEVWANQDSVTPQLTDGAGNPLDWTYQATTVKGS
jgi:hypothetical protein